MEYSFLLLIFGAGVFAGFLNVLAGGGSLLTLPVLILAGLPASLANGTNRVAILVQNVVAVTSFRRQGMVDFRLANRFAIAALPGAVVGAVVSIKIPEPVFNGILALVLIGAVFGILVRPRKSSKRSWNQETGRVTSYLAFLCFGFYGGFIQAGIGIVFILILYGVLGMDLVRVNAFKVYVVGLYTIPALAVFAFAGNVDWLIGGVLAMGNGIGAFVAARWSMKKGEGLVRWVLAAALVLMAIRIMWSL